MTGTLLTTQLQSGQTISTYEYFLVFDAQAHASFQIAVALSYIYKSFDNYKSTNEGGRQFKIDLAMSVMKYAIGLDRENLMDKTTKPKQIQHGPLVPCNCGIQFSFCKEMMTGIDQRVPGHPALEYHSIACLWEYKSIQAWKQDCSISYTKLHKQHADWYWKSIKRMWPCEKRMSSLQCCECWDINTEMIVSKLPRRGGEYTT